MRTFGLLSPQTAAVDQAPVLAGDAQPSVASELPPLCTEAHAVVHSGRSMQTSEWPQKFDSLQLPIEIVGTRLIACVEAEIVGLRIGRCHQLASDFGKMGHRFSRRVKDLYVQIARFPIVRLLARRREHHIGSTRDQLFGLHVWFEDSLRSSAVASLSYAFTPHTLGIFQRLREVWPALVLRGIVMRTTSSSNCEALCALARILARQAVRDHFSRALPSSQIEVDTNIHHSLLAAPLNA